MVIPVKMNFMRFGVFPLFKLVNNAIKPQNNCIGSMLNKIIKIIPRFVGWFSKSSWKKKTVIIIVILLAGFVIGRRILTGKNNGYVMDTAQKRTITEIVTESGTLTANGKVNIYSPTHGVVGDVYVSNGETVTEGQKLFSVKSTATPQEKTAALAVYQAAKTAVQQAENTRRATSATVDRVHDDLKNNDADESFLEKETRTTAEVANDNAYDALMSARTQLGSAQTAYQASQNATVTAPVSGLISNLSIVRGSSVSVTNPLISSPPVLIVAGLGTSEIMVSVGESDIAKIKVGQKVTIKLDAIKNKVYQGIVKRLDDQGSVTQGVVKFFVYIEVTDSDANLRSGMTADVDIVTSELTDVLSVPNTAVKPYQKGRAVRKLGGNGEPEFVPVKIGIRGKEFTQIIEGLSQGQEILVSLTNEKTPRKSSFGF